MRDEVDVCPSPNPTLNVQVKLLHECCLRLGGEHKLAEYLGVSVGVVEDWLAGRRPIPDRVFLLCVDSVRD